MSAAPPSDRPIWIVCGYGGLPAEGHRDYRCYLLGKALAERGQRVIWWTSSFNHQTKMQRKGTEISTGVAGFEVRLIQAPGYSGNVSIGRIWSEVVFGRRFKEAASDQECPATIVLAEPARFYGDVVAEVAHAQGARLVLDVMDLWPELFEMLVPRSLRWLGRIALTPLYRQRDRLVERAAAVVAVTHDYLDAIIGTKRPDLPRRVFLLGRHGAVAGEDEIPALVRSATVRANPGQVLLVYAGTLGNNYDMPALINAARLARERNVRWIVAGAGPLEEKVKAAESELGPDRFIFLGLQPASVMAWLLARCDVGLCCYREGSTVSLPLKAFDYMFAGLPIVTSLGRELGRLVDSEGIGTRYGAGKPFSLVDAVLALAGDGALRQRCSAAALRVAAQLQPDAQYRDYAEFLITPVLGGPH